MLSTITTKGQITIPKPIRNQLNLQTGDKVEFIIDHEGSVKLIPVTSSITKLKGILPKPKTIVSLEDMQKAIANEGDNP